LLRKLVHSTGQGLSYVDFPGYDNAEKKGWDGRVDAAAATPWIPLGSSGWEFGCNADPKKKADGDYEARVADIPPATTPATWSSGLLFVPGREGARPRPRLHEAVLRDESHGLPTWLALLDGERPVNKLGD
jgi:hypothetical protein